MITAMAAVGMYGNTAMGEDSSGGEEFPFSFRSCKEHVYIEKGASDTFFPRFAGDMVRLSRPEEFAETKPYKQLHRE